MDFSTFVEIQFTLIMLTFQKSTVKIRAFNSYFRFFGFSLIKHGKIFFHATFFT